MLKHLEESDVHRMLRPMEVIAAIEHAFRERYLSAVMPPRMQFPVCQGVCLLMPCHDTITGSLGMKIVLVRERSTSPATQPWSPDFSAPRVQASYLLCDSKTSQPVLSLSANYLTELRTAASSAIATKFLARQDARILAIFGTGQQAHAHLQILPLVRKFEKVLVCGSTRAKSEEFIATASPCEDLSIEAASPDVCASHADVICTCTNSKVPLLEGNLIRAGTHLNVIGAFQPRAREVDTITVQRARVVVDTYDGALAEAGDILIPMSEGAISRENILADLHELVAGKTRVRTSSNDITLFKSVGCALQDLATVELLMTGCGIH